MYMNFVLPRGKNLFHVLFILKIVQPNSDEV